ncbi:aldolase catalytic domain-containing protein [Cytobacillus firmus]|uniref:aldolase catalytic domain-containing protein n=1 Tax=Cytobacillus firmus TaxID=1399 RepID=UPI0034A29ACA
MDQLKLLDCTLRDGGYYNSWDFDRSLIQEYLYAMNAISIDYVEIGFRGFSREGFKGACAYTSDSFIRSLDIPDGLKIGVMVNAGDLLKDTDGIEPSLAKLFAPSADSPVSLVRIACHVHEFEAVLPACHWLKGEGYTVGFNLMQVADRSIPEIKKLASSANRYPVDVLYFADSMGSLDPERTSNIIKVLREEWKGPLGIHTHDNMGFALANSMRAVEEGVTWIDSTVTGMGRGPGNAKTEYIAIELNSQRQVHSNPIPLLKIIQKFFKPMQHEYGWGTNAYYYLAGKYGIHPTYIQEMLNDSRYNAEDILGIIEHLKSEGGKKFSINTLEAARNFYADEPKGTWNPADMIKDREVVIIGTGQGIVKHRLALEDYIRRENPFVIALNTQSQVAPALIDIRAACHPVRLLTDSSVHNNLPQPLVIPLSMLPKKIINAFSGKNMLDFGISIKENTFRFEENYCVLPNSLVIAYALAIAASGKASRILLAGFDGYGIGDPRSNEVDQLLFRFSQVPGTPQMIAVTPTQYKVHTTSIYVL